MGLEGDSGSRPRFRWLVLVAALCVGQALPAGFASLSSAREGGEASSSDSDSGSSEDITHIFIYETAGTTTYTTDYPVTYDTGPTSAGHTTGSAQCSVLFQLIMHEIGHAFGLGDRDVGRFSVMSSYMFKFCEPTPLDIVAIKAIYQSRK